MSGGRALAPGGPGAFIKRELIGWFVDVKVSEPVTPNLMYTQLAGHGGLFIQDFALKNTNFRWEQSSLVCER